MESESIKGAIASTLISALFAHWWFKNFEDSYHVATLLILGGLPSCSAAVWCMLLPTYAAVPVSYCLFYATLTASIVLYRVSSFHPLSKYPGPYVCRISKLWAMWIGSRGALHRYYKKLHDRYGPIVRVGPNELSIIDKAFIPPVLGSHGLPKGPLWDGRRISSTKQKGDAKTLLVLIGVRDTARHAQLRRAWNSAFAGGPLRDYEGLLARRAGQLVGHLEDRCRDASDGVGRVDLAEWFRCFSYDFMGDMAFGGLSELMRDGDTDGRITSLKESIYTLAVVQHIPWASRFLIDSPAGRKLRAFGAYTVERAKTRFSQEVKQKDLFHYLFQANADDPLFASLQLPLIVDNGSTAIIAGADTTATAICNIFYSVLAHPECYQRLRDEIDACFPTDRDHSTHYILANIVKLESLPYLNAVINETLRLFPPLPTSLQRGPAEDSGGTSIGTHFFPEGTAINIPPYTLHRSPEYFYPHPDAFWPERWLVTPADADAGTFVLDRSAYLPFSIGPAACPGRVLALRELRALLAVLVARFDVALEGRCSPAEWEGRLKDYLLFETGPLPVRLEMKD